LWVQDWDPGGDPRYVDADLNQTLSKAFEKAFRSVMRLPSVISQRLTEPSFGSTRTRSSPVISLLRHFAKAWTAAFRRHTSAALDGILAHG
jgi:hypothetical protein